jgi:hypothetical protein
MAGLLGGDSVGRSLLIRRLVVAIERFDAFAARQQEA